MKRIVIGIVVVVFVVGAVFVGKSIHQRREAERQMVAQAAQIQQAQQAAAEQAKRDVVTEASIEPRVTFDKVLEEHGIDASTANQIIQSARPVFKFRQLKPGNRLVLTSSVQGELRSVLYHVDPDHDLLITRDDSGFQAQIKDIPSKTETVGIAGQINGSLFEGVTDAGETPELAMRLADIFRWDLDFYTDPRPGDTFRVVMEKRTYENGQTVGYGRILAAEYENAGHVYQAVLFHDPQGRPAYYAGDGKSLQKAFLRSPLKFAARISSHFSRARFHPILKIFRPHLGTDYAAPTGTPVQTIANGRVVYAGPKGQDGNLVEIAHSSGYQTYYMHLSRILVRRGQSVVQGQTIGRVGMTGLATGPHLDFRLRQRGQFVNFERLKLPPAMPVAKKDWKEFHAERDQYLAMMPTEGTKGTVVAKAETPATQGQSGGK